MTNCLNWGSENTR